MEHTQELVVPALEISQGNRRKLYSFRRRWEVAAEVHDDLTAASNQRP